MDDVGIVRYKMKNQIVALRLSVKCINSNGTPRTAFPTEKHMYINNYAFMMYEKPLINQTKTAAPNGTAEIFYLNKPVFLIPK